MTMLALFTVGFLMPFYFEELRGFSTLYSGLLLTPLALTIAALAPLSGAVADRLNSRCKHRSALRSPARAGCS